MNEDIAFEQLLRLAMASRPEPVAAENLAQRAMTLARRVDSVQLHQRANRLARQRRWAQLSGLAAVLLIGLMLAGAFKYLWARGDIAALAQSASITDSSNSTTADDTATAAASTSSTSRTLVIAVACGLLVSGLVLLTLPRTAPPMPLGAELAAGLW